jgi:hypothetical protein
MALVGKTQYRGIPLDRAIIRQEYHPQVFKNEGRVHLIFALYASQEAKDKGELPLVDRYLEVDVWERLAPGVIVGSRRDGGREETTRVTLHYPDLACIWGKAEPPDGFPTNLWAQGYFLIKNIRDLEGFASDEQ